VENCENINIQSAMSEPEKINNITDGTQTQKEPPKEKPPPIPADDDTSSCNSISPPDGGWGWVVVFASFMIHIIADGITYSFGVFLVELITVFEVDRGVISFIPSILVGVTLGSGPIASSLTNRFGCRVVTIAGSVLAAAGMAFSVLAKSVGVLYFTVGICTGLGFGLIYLPAIVSVSVYFEKKRAFATGIAVCGSGVGTFIMAPVTKGLIQQLGWEGAMLVTAGLILNCILFGCLMRPLEVKSKNCKKEEHASTEKNKMLPVLYNGTAENEAYSPKLDSCNPPPYIKPFAQQICLTGGGDSDMARMAMSHPAFLDQSEKPQVHFGSAAQFLAVPKPGLPTSRSEVMRRKDVFYSGSLLNIPEYRRDPHQYRRSVRDIDKEDDSHSVADKQEYICCCMQASPKQAEILNQMLDISLFKDPVFMMYATSNFLTSIGFNVPYVFTVDRALEWGMESKQAAFLLSVIGIANTIGRIILGWLSDRGEINRLYLYNSCLVVCGVSMGLSVFCNTYITQAVYCAIFGVTSGAYVGLTSVVLVDLLGLDKLTNAFGLLLLFQGIASVIGPPIIGALYDSIGDYDAGFYFAGTMIFISGAMLFAIPALQHRLRNKKPTFKITSGMGTDEFLTET